MSANDIDIAKKFILKSVDKDTITTTVFDEEDTSKGRSLEALQAAGKELQSEGLARVSVGPDSVAVILTPQGVRAALAIQ